MTKKAEQNTTPVADLNVAERDILKRLRARTKQILAGVAMAHYVGI
jgi:hypothetical protein